MEFSLGPYRLEVATDFGPRITSLRLGHGPEVLASLGPEAVIQHDHGTYSFRGGHRLWVAPEVAAITYAPDDHECTVVQDERGVVVTAPTDIAGVDKEMTISLDATALVVSHRVSSAETGSRLAPWAITQLPMGGTAILPLVGADLSPLANRYLVLWPYTSLDDPRITTTSDAILIDAVDGEPQKLGVGPTPHRLAYLHGDTLFLKEIDSPTDREVPDFGAVGQIYLGQGFCELESVGGLADLSTEGATLRERWSVLDCPDIETARRLVVSGP